MKDIIVLTKVDCPLCKRLKKELDRNGVIYREFDAENDTEGMAYVHFYGLSGSVLPRVIINDDVLPPHDTIKETLDTILKRIGKVSYIGCDSVEIY